MGSKDPHGKSMTKSEVKRRSLVRGAAWTVPTIAAATAAPMAAASPIPPRGLNGWVQLRRNCFQGDEFQIDGRGNFTGGGTNDRGIWTFVDQSTPPVTSPGISAEIVFSFNRSNMNFINASGSGWSNLVRDTSLDGISPTGYFAYRATYSGTWTYSPLGGGAYVADGDPYWREEDISNCSNGVCGYARRTIWFPNESITFTRGPVCV